tara:strand:- start:2356 stop:3399 length:1044 start_codon:yes stop_codon:yes gene_type:complete
MSDLSDSTSLPFKRFRSEGGPIIDIRSEGEYAQGHWPGSINLPLLNNQEREIIGITYKRQGRDIAIKAGLKLISPKLPQIKKSLHEIANLNNKKHGRHLIRVYCWRGGLRSKAIVWLSNLLGIKSFQLKNGYKSYRKWALDQFEAQWPLKVIGGRTGTGKTDILHSLIKRKINVIDLEGLANHRGSSFGSIGLGDQPTSEQFENLIAESLNDSLQNSSKTIWVEDESPNLGKCRIPYKLYRQMKDAPLIEIIRSKEERLKRLTQLYGNLSKQHLLEATIRISKRLGPQRTNLALKAIENENWEQACLAMLDYYDKSYDYQLKNKPIQTTLDISSLTDDEVSEKLSSF